MGAQDVLWRGLFVAGGIAMLVLGHSLQAKAQVIINEKMELDAQSTATHGEDPTVKSSNGNSDGFPFWYPIEQNKFVLLKSGDLNLSFEDARLQQMLSRSDKLRLTIFRDGEEIRSRTVTPLDHLPEPMNVNEPGCYGDRFVYNTDTMRVGIGTSDGEGKDAFVARGLRYPNIFANENFGDHFHLVLSGQEGSIALRPDSVNHPDSLVVVRGVSYLDFDLSNMKSQVNILKAKLALGLTSSYYGDEVFLKIGKTTGSWNENTITWNNQPSAGNGTRKLGFTKYALYHFDITSMVQSGGSSSIGFKLDTVADSLSHVFDSKEGYLSPALLLDIANPAAPPEDPSVSIENLKAGDILKWELLDFEVNDQFSNLAFGEDYYELELLGDIGNCSIERVNIRAEIKEAYSGLPQIQMALEINPETVAPGDTTQITPMMSFVRDTSTAPFPQRQNFEAALIEGAGHATLWDGRQDTANFYPHTQSPFYFIAADSIAEDSVASTVGAFATLSLQDDLVPTVNATSASENSPPTTTRPPAPLEIEGSRNIIIRKQDFSIEIDIPGSRELWPTLRDRDGGNPDNRNIKENIITSLTRSGEPVSDHPVEIKAIRVEGSGGHNHELDGEKLPQDRVATFTHEGEESLGALEAQTDQNGALEFDYTGSMVSGTYILQATTQVDGDSLFARDTLVVRAPNLVFLGEDTSYVLSGGTCDHYGASTDGIAARCQSPDNNHYITDAAKDSLIAASEEYLTAPWNTTGEKIRVNDISLPLGGYFGINSDWTGAHVSHRIGEDVDIENSSKVQRLKKVFERNGWDFIPHDGSGFYPHFRLED
jgi:hypothetical protein